MQKKIGFVLLLNLLSAFLLNAQDKSKQFADAKALFREGKYNLAMAAFKPLIPYDQNNPYREYASFYYGLSAHHLGYHAVAKDQFQQIKTLHPKWDKMDEVNYWLAAVAFNTNDPVGAMKIIGDIQNQSMQQDLVGLKEYELAKINDLGVFKVLLNEFPKDKSVATVYARKLAGKNAPSRAEKELLEKLIKDFNLNRSMYIPDMPRTVLKDEYSVSVMMPFMVSTLDPAPGTKRNQIILDFYKGMQLAVDTLRRNNVRISLRAYDTKRDESTIKDLLKTEEIRNTDLIIGPFFSEENKLVQEFAEANQINIIQPFSSNSDMIEDNPFAFMIQPSFETIGQQSAAFLADYLTKKNTIIFYGTEKRDSVLVANFEKVAREKGLRIKSKHKIGRNNASVITSTLATPTEYDEFKYPKQFTLKKDSIGSIFVASDDVMIVTKVLGAVETRGDQPVVLGSENWLIESSSMDMGKYINLPVVMASPNFHAQSSAYYPHFLRKYIRTNGVFPSRYARLGFECMMLAGNLLKKYGTYFQEGLQKQSVPGYLSQGFDFRNARDNQKVPFVKFEDAVLKSLH